MQIKITLTNDLELEKLPHYQTVFDIVERLNNSNVLQNLHGNCVAAADMVTAMLLQSGIESIITECQVSICVERDGQKYYNLVGYDNFSFNGQVDTHVVVITKTEVPILIDLSISQFMPDEHPFVVERVCNNDPNILANYTIGDYSLVYQTKRNIRLPTLHQKTILERISEDAKSKEKIKLVSTALFVLLGFTMLNFVANVLLVFLKLT